jgi:hypothetical protein
MLSHADLVTLEKQLRDKMVLSIYVNGDFADVAVRDQWRTELRNKLDDIEESLREASHTEREGFGAARRIAEAQVDRYRSGDGTPGWIAFVSEDAVHHAAAAPVQVPTSATWSLGANVAPAIRVLKEADPVLVVVTDKTNARIHRYAGRTIELVDSFEWSPKIDQASHTSKMHPHGFNSGTRGETGTDAAQREEANATSLMLGDAAVRLQKLAMEGGWVLIGGIHVIATDLHGRLDKRLTNRSAVIPLDVHDGDARLSAAAREHVSKLREADDLRRVEEVISANAEGSTGAVGMKEIDGALVNGQVHELFMTSKFETEQPDEAVAAIRRAFDGSATVEHVSGKAAERLDATGGIAARLRFVITPVEETAGR